MEQQLVDLNCDIAAGSRQLRAARDALCAADCNTCADIAYYELDVKLSQQRPVFPMLDSYTVKSVPVLLLRWNSDAIGTAFKLSELKAAGVPKHR